MHIKRFEAPSMKEALARIRSELGSDALILETRRADDGSGWFEVTAALPHGGETDRASARSAYARSGLPGKSPTRAELGSAIRSLADGLAPTGPRGGHAPAARSGEPAGAPSPGAKTPAGPVAGNVSARVAEILSRLPRENVAPALTPEQQRRFLGDEPAGSASAPAPVRSSGEETRRLRERTEYLSRLIRSEHFSAIPLPLRELYLDLCEAEIDANLSFEILSRMGSAPMKGQFQPVPPDQLLQRLRKLVSVGGAVEAGTERRVLALVGPTGVGKTTTVAKIAGQAAFALGRRVALVSTDSYRVFGAQHLGSYAALMGLPFATAGSSEEMRQLLEVDFQDRDLVLVDTSGRSPRDPEGIAEIHRVLEACPEADVHLVLAANARVRDMAFAFEGFSRLPIRHLAFTKLDETTRRGGIFTLALKARRPVSYLATGQEVPDDLEPASAAALCEGLALGKERSVA